MCAYLQDGQRLPLKVWVCMLAQKVTQACAHTRWHSSVTLLFDQRCRVKDVQPPLQAPQHVRAPLLKVPLLVKQEIIRFWFLPFTFLITFIVKLIQEDFLEHTCFPLHSSFKCLPDGSSDYEGLSASARICRRVCLCRQTCCLVVCLSNRAFCGRSWDVSCQNLLFWPVGIFFL